MYLKITENGIEQLPNNAADEYLEGFEFYPNDTRFDEQGVQDEQPDGWAERAGRAWSGTQWVLSDGAEKAAAIVVFNKEIGKYRKIITGGASPEEQAGWSRKAAAAARHGKGEAIDTDGVLASAEAQARGLNETPDQLFAKWAAKDALYMQALGTLDGMKAAAVLAIEGAAEGQASIVLEEQLSQLRTAVEALG